MFLSNFALIFTVFLIAVQSQKKPQCFEPRLKNEGGDSDKIENLYTGNDQW